MLAQPSPMCTLDGASIPDSAYRRSRTGCDGGDVSWARLIVRGPLVPRVVPCIRHRTEHLALVRRRQRAPQRVSQRSLLIRRDALRREPVTHLASEAQQPAVANLG